jgi:prepilin-type N-terminal cleavage/methylation domain-containing protein
LLAGRSNSVPQAILDAVIIIARLRLVLAVVGNNTMKTMPRHHRGFTLVEIMIVVAIIALLAAIAIPNFVRSRGKAQATVCVSNMRKIDDAIQQYATETKVAETQPVTAVLLAPYLKAGMPKCPVGQVDYTVTTVDGSVWCQNYPLGSSASLGGGDIASLSAGALTSLSGGNVAALTGGAIVAIASLQLDLLGDDPLTKHILPENEHLTPPWATERGAD